MEQEFGNVGFFEGVKTGVPGENLSEQRRRTNIAVVESGNRSRATAPSLLNRELKHVRY